MVTFDENGNVKSGKGNMREEDVKPGLLITSANRKSRLIYEVLALRSQWWMPITKKESFEQKWVLVTHNISPCNTPCAEWWTIEKVCNNYKPYADKDDYYG